MLTILNDSMIKNVTCSVCEKYLSVLPVKVYPNRRMKCGRCCEKDDDGIESSYGKVIKKCLFKCVNRYEGCNKLLTVSEVVQHESECISRNYNCPKCDYKFSGSSYHLVLHYTKQHPRSILRNESFVLRIKKDFRERYLYLIMDRIFFVLVEYLSAEKVLYLSAVSLIPQKNVMQWFTVKQFQKQQSITTTKKNLCQSLEHFQCDYFTVQVSTMNEIHCRLHLDLSQDTCNVDQISANKEPEKIATVSICTQTDPVPLVSMLKKPNKDDNSEEERPELDPTTTPMRRRGRSGYRPPLSRIIIKKYNQEQKNVSEVKDQEEKDNTSESAKVQTASEDAEDDQEEEEEENASISANSENVSDPLKPPHLSISTPATNEQQKDEKHNASIGGYVTSFFKSIRKPIGPSLSRPESEISINPVSQGQNHNASSVSTSVQTLSNIIGVKLTDEFRNKYPGYELTACGTGIFKGEERIELICFNCKQFTGCNVFNCQLNKHIVCWDCKAWCGICDTPTNGWNVEITEINELLQLPCKWQCGEVFPGNLLTQHELKCEKPTFGCPLCSRMLMNFNTLSNHLVVYHMNYRNIAQFNLTGYFKDPSNKNRLMGNVCFFQNGQFFKMSWRCEIGVFKVEIQSFGDTSLYELAIICDKGILYNKITNGKAEFDLKGNPKFYLKRIRNL